MEGNGYLIDMNLIEYTGLFIKGVLEGKGTLKINTTLYHGEFKGGKFSNGIVQTQRNDTVIIAKNADSFKNNMTGLMSLYFNNGYLLETEMTNGKFVINKMGKLTYAGQKYWFGKIIIKNNLKYFESNTPSKITYQVSDDTNAIFIL